MPVTATEILMEKEALYYQKLEGGAVQCRLCAHRCRILEGRKGLCGVRQNKQGVLYTMHYPYVAAVGVDPIEKKPLYHFLPGTDSYSVAGIGCNFRCQFCQNWQLSQVHEALSLGTKEIPMPPQEIVARAAAAGCKSISYTYSEPTVFFELACETAHLARDAGLRNVFVTNGYMSCEALDGIAPYLDAANIDLKSFRESFYKKVCGASLAPVLDTIAAAKRKGVWIEITTLVIPGLNDTEEELDSLASFIASLDCGIPWHISRFHPDYRLHDREATGGETLKKAYNIGKNRGLKYVYIGNYQADYAVSTKCPSCGKTVIERCGFSVSCSRLSGGRCPFCHAMIDGFFA